MANTRRDTVTCSRRDLWRVLLQEILVLRGSIKGGQGCRLADLSSLPDEQLARVRPTLNTDCQVFADQGYVCGRLGNSKDCLRLFAENRENLVAFNLFDGEHRLDEIGARVSQEMSWDESKAFAHTRDLFLSLVRHMVCFPKDPLEIAK